MSELREVWAEWLEGRPPKVREVAKKFPPWMRFRIKGGVAEGTVISFGETPEGEVKLMIHLTENVVIERTVFDLKPDELEAVVIPENN